MTAGDGSQHGAVGGADPSTRRLACSVGLIGVYLLTCCVFAVVTTEDAQRAWARMAVVGYAGALLTAGGLLGATRGFRALSPADDALLQRRLVAHRRVRRATTGVVVAGAVVVPVVLLVLTGTGQPEVDVVRDGGRAMLLSGTPYVQDADRVAEFRPYLPATFLFGVLPGVLGDIRVWGALLFAVAVRSVRASAVPAQRAVFDDRLGLLLAFPLVALAAAASGIDLPQAALTMYAIGLCASARCKSAGIAVGLTLAMKPTALCAVFVLALMAWRRRDTRAALTFMAVAGTTAAVLVLPVALRDPSGLWDNVFRFPAGAAGVASPAASPFPGVLLRTGGAPSWVQTALVAMTATGVAVWCWRHVRPQPRSAAFFIASGFTAAFAVVPYSRAGYLVLPALVYFPYRFAASVSGMSSAADATGGTATT